MAARGARADRTEKHHIGTISNKKSTLRGGPWTPRLERLFARAGMRLADRENIVPIKGHKGRPEGWEVVLIISEEIKDALERMGAAGTRFEEV